MRSPRLIFLGAAAFVAIAVSSITLFAQSPGGTSTQIPSPVNPADGDVANENGATGSTGWQSPELARGRGRPISEPVGAQPPARPLAEPVPYTLPVISGYADLSSVNRGGTINLKVSTTAPTYNIDIYRMGWYAGAGSRLMSSVAGLTGSALPIPAPDPVSGLVEANWPTAYSLKTGAGWTSGVYLAKLTASTGSVGYITFVVRNDSSRADILYQVPVATYQAYNDFGGKSLYWFGSPDNIAATQVSFDRPYSAWSGAGSFFDGDYNMIRWLESRGYSVTYTTSVDTQTSPALLNGHKVFLSNFHDEYWSKAMRDNVTAARDRGMGLAWFAANSMYWQIRWDANAAGTQNRRIISYKESALASDPMVGTNPALTTTVWRGSPVNLPENAILGSMYESAFTFGTAYPWVVQNSSHWVYKGTGLSDGAQIPGLVGYEYDKMFANGLAPSSTVKLAESPLTNTNGSADVHNATIYTAASKAIVFNAGTIQWAWKLDDNPYHSVGADGRVQRMTANVLNAMIDGAPAATPAPTTTAAPTGSNLVVYGDALNSAWRDSSWGATTNLANASPVFAGSAAISTTVNLPWGGLYLSTATAVGTNSGTSLTFAMQASAAGQRFVARLVDSTGVLAGTSVQLVNTGGDPVAGSWRTYDISLGPSGFNLAGRSIRGIVIQDMTGAPQPAAFIDEITLKSVAATGTPAATPTQAIPPTATPTAALTATPTPLPPTAPVTTPTPVPTSTPVATPTATPSPAPGTGLVIYSDAVNAAWSNASWNATVNLANAAPVSAGAKSIAMTITSAWGALYLTAGAPVSAAGYTTLNFAMRASAANQRFAVVLTNAGATVGVPVVLAAAGGDPVAGSWKSYAIPIGPGGFNAAGLTITGFYIQDYTGAAQPVVYVDEIALR